MAFYSGVRRTFMIHLTQNTRAQLECWSGQRYTYPWSVELKLIVLDSPEPSLLRTDGLIIKLLYSGMPYIYDTPKTVA